MEYNIISDKSSNRLIELVNEQIQQGWQPIGGVCVIAVDTVLEGQPVKIFQCYQAMTRG